MSGPRVEATEWSAAVTVTEHAVSDMFNWQLVTTDTGDVVLVWQSDVTGRFGPGLFARILASSEGAMDPPIELATGGWAEQPCIRANSDGGIAVAWIGNAGGGGSFSSSDRQIQFSTFPDLGAGRGFPQRSIDLQHPLPHFDHQMSLARDGLLLMTFGSSDGYSAGIWAWVSRQQERYTTQLTEEPTSIFARNLITSDGTLLVAWPSNGAKSLHVASLAPNEGRFWRRSVISPDDGWKPVLAETHDGTVGLVYSTGDNPTMFAARAIAPYGPDNWTEPVRISNPARSLSDPQLCTSQDGILFAAWIQDDHAIIVSTFDSETSSWSAPRTVVDYHETLKCLDLAPTSDGSISLTWLVSGNGHDGIERIEHISCASQSFGLGDIEVVYEGRSIYEPHTVIGRNATAFICWFEVNEGLRMSTSRR